MESTRGEQMFFHATTVARGEKAKKNGLKPRIKARVRRSTILKSRPELVYLFDDLEFAESFGTVLTETFGQEYVVLKIDLTPEMEAQVIPDPHFDIPYAWAFPGTIPANCIVDAVPIPA